MIKVITDSTSDIPQTLIEELDISVVPLKVHFSSETYTDGQSITPDLFYKKLVTSDSLPTTSQPSPIHFQEAYTKAIQAGYTAIISIHLSSALSGTYQSAMLAKEMMDQKQVPIELVDSKTASYGIGLLVVAVARAAKEGKSVEECLALSHQLRSKQLLLAYVDTLEYLQRGGRIGKAAALVGSLLQIKPIITLDDDGEVDAVEKVRGKKKAMRKIFSMIEQQIPKGSEVSVAILSGELTKEAEQWSNYMHEHYQVKELVNTRIGPVIGTHAGPNSIGIIVYPVSPQ